MGIKKRNPSVPGLAIEIPLHVMNTWIGLHDNQALNLIGSCQSQKKTDAVGDDMLVKLERKSQSVFAIMFDQVKTAGKSNYTVKLPDVVDSSNGSGSGNLAGGGKKRGRKRTNKARLDVPDDRYSRDTAHVLHRPHDQSQGLLESRLPENVSELSSQATEPGVASVDLVKCERNDDDGNIMDVNEGTHCYAEKDLSVNVNDEGMNCYVEKDLNVEIKTETLAQTSDAGRKGKPARKYKPKCERVPRKPGRRQDKHCIYCGDTFRAVSTRIFHEKYKCPDNPARQRVYYCSSCSKKFLDPEEFDLHRAEHAKEDFKLVCTDCGKIYRTRPGLYIHRLNKHSDMQPRFKCEVCHKEFYRKIHLQHHSVVHTDSRPCQCEVCGKRFKDRSAVIKHRKTVHEDTYPYRCEKCGHGMDKLKYLKAHQCGRVRRNQDLKPENHMHKRKKSASKSEPSSVDKLLAEATTNNLMVDFSHASAGELYSRAIFLRPDGLTLSEPLPQIKHIPYTDGDLYDQTRPVEGFPQCTVPSTTQTMSFVTEQGPPDAVGSSASNITQVTESSQAKPDSAMW